MIRFALQRALRDALRAWDLLVRRPVKKSTDPLVSEMLRACAAGERVCIFQEARSCWSNPCSLVRLCGLLAPRRSRTTQLFGPVTRQATRAQACRNRKAGARCQSRELSGSPGADGRGVVAGARCGCEHAGQRGQLTAGDHLGPQARVGA
jgi:hypothetical protein